MLFTVPKFDIPYGPVIWGFVILMVAGCASCAFKDDSISDLVENLAENCKGDMDSVELDFDEDGKKLDDLRLKCKGLGK